MSAAFIPIPTSDLPLRESYGFDLYLTYNKKFILFRHKSLPVDEGMINQLRDNGVDRIFIQQRDYPRYLQLVYADGGEDDITVRRHLLDRYMVIESRTLRSGTQPPFVIFTLQEGTPVPVIAPDMPGVSAQVDGDLLADLRQIYILKRDMTTYSEYVNAIWREYASFTPLNWEGGLIVRESAKMAAHGLFHATNVDQALKQADESLTGVLDRVLDNPETYYSLLKVSDQDFNTYIHSVNVSVLAMGLGLEMRLQEKAIHHLGMGGLLHDIGKRRLDQLDYWNKAHVSPDTYEELKEHVIMGREFCEGRREFSVDVLDIVSQHHERLDGSGFPEGLRGDRLNHLGQIVAVLEVYDSLTNHLPFRQALTPFQALKQMRQMRSRINQDVLTVFIKLLGNQKKDN